MNTEEMTVGDFGEIKAGMVGYKKTLHGRITDKDTFGNIFFEDNEGYSYIFSPGQIDEWEVKEFTELPEKYYWDFGRVINVETKKETEIRK